MLQSRLKALSFFRRAGRRLLRFAVSASALFLCLLVLRAEGLRERELSLLSELQKDKNLIVRGEFRGGGDVSLSYLKFGKRRGRNGALIFVNGKGENHTKYLELFYDLNRRGWSPVYAYDHRGEGFSSEAALPETPGGFRGEEGGKTPLYDAYRKDFKAFVRFVLNEIGAERAGRAEAQSGGRRAQAGAPRAAGTQTARNERSRLFVTAHSMGAAVFLDYLQAAGEGAPFQAAALSAPMIKIRSGAVSFLKPVFRGVCLLSSFLCRRRLIPSLRGRLSRKALTDSKARFQFAGSVIEQFPQAASQGTSFQWLAESLDVGKRLEEEGRIRKIAVPLLILQSRRDRFVSNKAQELFCKRLPRCCHIRRIDGKHEIFMEKDGPRDHALLALTLFFQAAGFYRKTCGGGGEMIVP